MGSPGKSPAWPDWSTETDRWKPNWMPRGSGASTIRPGPEQSNLRRSYRLGKRVGQPAVRFAIDSSPNSIVLGQIERPSDYAGNQREFLGRNRHDEIASAPITKIPESNPRSRSLQGVGWMDYNI